MIKFSRLFASLALTAAAGLSSAAFAVTTYDGTYRIDVTTDVGDCQRTVSGSVTLSDGLIVATSDSAVQSWGRVGGDGVVSFAFHRGADVAHVSGRLKGASGQGAWWYRPCSAADAGTRRECAEHHPEKLQTFPIPTMP